ncbi:MAG: sigma-70 family RNA polymerase sigma factor [Nitrospirae bacterium]|nr:sigma-70 family RNA polymerase sigma factor [Nitrospirota bacterium]
MSPVGAMAQPEASQKSSSASVTSSLLAAVAKGDQQAFAQVYDATSSILFTLALRMLGDRDEAADLLQDVYSEVWRKGTRYDPARGTPTAWLVTLTRSRGIDRLRSRAAKGGRASVALEDSPAAEQAAGDGPGPLDMYAELELRSAVAKALGELPDTQQQALELAYYEGLSHTEIADRLKQPLGTIKTRIKLGMDKLRTTLQSHWEPR